MPCKEATEVVAGHSTAAITALPAATMIRGPLPTATSVGLEVPLAVPLAAVADQGER